MKLHEFQAKEILKSFGVPVPKGAAASTAEEAAEFARTFPAKKFAVKAQAHAGGRGKAGGIKIVDSADEVLGAARSIIGMKLVTRQTGAEGMLVSKVLVEHGVDVAHEFYLSLLVDRERGRIAIIASAEGGMEIEESAAKNPEKIITRHIEPASGLMPFICRDLARSLELPHASSGKFAAVVRGSYEALIKTDLSLIEINPLVLTRDGNFVALDAKAAIDDNAMFRHKSMLSFRDETQEDPRELEAEKYGLSYISLDGSIGCLVNGAGLAMATMDIIKFYGESPANFLDVGGSASVEAVTEGFKIILSDRGVRAILVNIFGGIMRCDVVAESIVAAAKEVSIEVPLIVRLQGTNCDVGKEILAKSGLSIIPAVTMDDAAKKAVEAVKKNGNHRK